MLNQYRVVSTLASTIPVESTICLCLFLLSFVLLDLYFIFVRTKPRHLQQKERCSYNVKSFLGFFEHFYFFIHKIITEVQWVFANCVKRGRGDEIQSFQPC